jgi:hypothetical protein
MTDSSGGRHGQLVVGLVVGFLLGAGLLIAASDVRPPDQSPDPSNPPVSQTVGSGCVQEEAIDTGWAHQVGAGNYRLFTANLTVGHGADQRANASFVTRSPGVYELRVSSTGDGKGTAVDEAQCPTGSTVRVAASLPLDYESVTVVVGGERIATVERSKGTLPDLSEFAWGARADPGDETTQTDTNQSVP